MNSTVRMLLLLAAVAPAACGDDGGASWGVVHQDQPAALLSVWGSSPTDVWVVGGRPSATAGPTVLHFDGAAWTQLDSGITGEDLWWVFGFADGPVFMGGSGGTILRYQNGAFSAPMTTPSATPVVFGIWGSAPDDIWAVGGNYGGQAGGFAWHYDGAKWSLAPGFPAAIATGGTVFKVSGLATDNVWMVGQNGIGLHWNGTALVEQDASIGDDALFSVCENGTVAMTVGGQFAGLILENDGSGWTDVSPTGLMGLIGVSCNPADAYAVGIEATVVHRTSSGWAAEDIKLPVFDNLHAVWLDPEGGVWAVGGQFGGIPTTSGLLIHKGKTTIPGGIQ